jgi:hypothetical protein
MACIPPQVVTVCGVTPASALVMVTFAPGITELEESFTNPVIPPVVVFLTGAKWRAGQNQRQGENQARRLIVRHIISPRTDSQLF